MILISDAKPYLWFQKWHDKFAKLSLEHLKI